MSSSEGSHSVHLDAAGLPTGRKLIKLYGKAAVRKEFKKPQAGLYQPGVLNFAQHVLGVANINQNRYLKNVYK